MERTVSRLLAAAACLLAVASVVGHFDWTGENTAQAEIRQSLPGDLFYNYYAPGAVHAKMYPCPRPTPPVVGHTYVTYQPLMPHEFLWKHKRVYWHKHPGSGWTRTKIKWR